MLHHHKQVFLFNYLEDTMNNYSRKSILSLVITLILTASAASAFGHCQVPCGIYDDSARVDAMKEDVTTIKKAMRLINELAGKTDAQSQNQLVRWVNTKEIHTQKIITSIADYFLTQRVKADQQDYLERLRDHHAVIVAAMKAKQNTAPEVAELLDKAVDLLGKYYPAHHEHN